MLKSTGRVRHWSGRRRVTDCQLA